MTQTKSEIQARLNKGQKLLTDESKESFQAAVAAYAQEVKRTPAKFRRQDLEHVFQILVSCYRAQEKKGADVRMHKATRTYSEATQELIQRTKERANRIAEIMQKAKAAALRNRKSVKVTVSE